MGILVVRAVFLVVALLQAPTVRQLQSGIVKGALRTSTGLPLQGVRVAVEPVEKALDAGILESIAMTDGEGRYVLENVSPGRYRLFVGRVDSPLYHPGVVESTEATTVVVVAGETTVVPDMVFFRTRIAGRVIDLKTGQGRSIKSLSLCCNYTGTSSLTGRVSPSPTAVSIVITESTMQSLVATVNDDGTFVFADVPTGKYFLQAHDPGIVPVAQSVEVSRQGVEGLEFKVTDGVRVDGFVVDQHNQRVTSLNITLKPDAGNAMLETEPTPSGLNVVRTVGTSVGPSQATVIVNRLVTRGKSRTMLATANGEFSFERVLPGRYTLEANAPGGNAFSREIEVRVQEVHSASLEMPFTQVKGHIVAGDGSALPRISGSVRLVSSDPNARVLFGFPDDAGRFSILATPGEYRVLTDTMNVDRSIESIVENSVNLRTESLVIDGARTPEIRITIVP
jgi:hypothetical protein